MKALWLAPLFLTPVPQPATVEMSPCYFQQFRTPDRAIPQNHHGLKRFNKDMA